ncbi:MAG TPA: hypothetical protein VGK73_11510 [Polyangiaceae bacterium]
MATTEEEPTAKMPPGLARAALRDSLAHYYATWLDIPLHELGGNTPRQAARTAAGRLQVHPLVEELENKARETGLSDTYNFDDLRRALGLAPRSS